MLQLLNSLTRKAESARPLRGRTVRMYTCGPTVYDFAHIGNLRTYIFEDILKRVLLLDGYRVRHVMNITDVGHLTSDADDGEDKIERAAAKAQKTAAQITAFYTRAFLRDLRQLHVLPADEYPRATAYIRAQIALVRRLERRRCTYVTSDGVYFDTAKFPAYGQAFGGQIRRHRAQPQGDGQTHDAHSRISVNPEKRSPHDFALWKFSSPRIVHGSETRDYGVRMPKRHQEWSSPWGVGFPGWHLECSAMGRALLGQPFDLHAGGIDHIPIHHTNEIAQSEAAYGKPLARVWVHGAFLTVDGKRMGKSEGNLITIDELFVRGFDPLSFRYLVLGAHYRSPLNFTWEALTGAEIALEHLREICRTLPRFVMPDSRHARLRSAHALRAGFEILRPRSDTSRAIIDQLRAAFHDDLDTPKALAVLWECMKTHDPAIPLTERSAIMAYADQVFGLALVQELGRKIRIPRDVQRLVAEREAARARKDWARADVLRVQVQALGFTIEDTKDRAVVRSRARRS